MQGDLRQGALASYRLGTAEWGGKAKPVFRVWWETTWSMDQTWAPHPLGGSYSSLIKRDCASEDHLEECVSGPQERRGRGEANSQRRHRLCRENGQ